MIETATKRSTPFDQWMAKVSRIMYRRCGMGPDDLPDWCYRASYDAGETANDAATQAIAYAKDS